MSQIDVGWWEEEQQREQEILDSLPDPEPITKTDEITYLGAPPKPDTPSPVPATNELIRQRIAEQEMPKPEEMQVLPPAQQEAMVEPIPESVEPKRQVDAPPRRQAGSNLPFLEQGSMMAPESGDRGNEEMLRVMQEIAEASKDETEQTKAVLETLQAMNDKLDDVGKLGP